jgi:hypothetical protein
VINSIRKEPYRNIATILCFIVIAGTLLTTTSSSGGVGNSVEVGTDRLGADLVVLPQPPPSRDRPSSSGSSRQLLPSP